MYKTVFQVREYLETHGEPMRNILLVQASWQLFIRVLPNSLFIKYGTPTLLAIVSRDQTNWDTHLPVITMA